MGLRCCTRFHKTWWPGHTSDAIDPNKAFNVQRRWNRIKKAVIALFIVAFVVLCVYLLVRLTSGNDAKSSNYNNSEHHSINMNTAAALSGTGISSPHNSTTTPINPSRETPLEFRDVVLSNSAVPVTEAEGAGDNEKIESTVELIKSDEPRAWCASKQNTIECVGLTKDFKTITSYSEPRPGSGKWKHPAGGYIFVKIDNSSTWYPYCYHSWTLNMGYKLCKALGFNKLDKLETIDIENLRQRVPQLGQGISLEKGSQQMAVLSGQSSTDNLTSSNQCNVGLILCKPKSKSP